MAARECEIEMTLEILDEVAFLFVEQFDNLYGMLVDRTDASASESPLMMAKMACSRWSLPFSGISWMTF